MNNAAKKLSKKEFKALDNAIATLRAEGYSETRAAIELAVEFGVPEHVVLDRMYA